MSAFKTTDLYDTYLDTLQVATSIFKDFGGKQSFFGQLVTLKAYEDNSFLKAAFETDGKGKVLVVDSNASLRCALMGDVMATLAADNNWEGVILNGCIRDSAGVSKVNLGVKALATSPRKTIKRNKGITDIPLHFADITFFPNHYIYADEDGIVTSSQPLVSNAMTDGNLASPV